MTADIQYEFDVALSYASEDVSYVEAVAEALKRQGLKVFFDRFQEIEVDLLGRNLVDQLSAVYQYKARLCVIFISKAYARKPYTRLERQAAQARVIEANSDEPYIIPVRMDDAAIPGLFSTVVYSPAKRPELLAATLAAKLRSLAAPAYKVEGLVRGSSVVIRFNSLLEFDSEAFDTSLNNFSHWSSASLSELPIEVGLPAEMETAREAARAFRTSDVWTSRSLSDEARKQWEAVQMSMGDDWLEMLVKGVRLLIRRYKKQPNRRRSVIRLWCVSAVLARCRLLDVSRLIGQAPYLWSGSFARFAAEWSQSIINGLTYLSFLDGHERFLWFDADLWLDRDRSGRAYRVFVPSTLCLDQSNGSLCQPQLDPHSFDEFIAVQLVETAVTGEDEYAFPWTATDYPSDTYISLRAEVAIDSDHFARTVVSNFDGEALEGSVRRLRSHLLDTIAGTEPSDHRKRLYLMGLHGLVRSNARLGTIALDG